MKYLVLAAALILGLSAVFSMQQDAEKVYSVEELLNSSEDLEGENITVRGELFKGKTICTQEVCLEDQCCNTCSAQLRLGRDGHLKIQNKELGCSGTNCGINCTPETGENYLFEGQLENRYGQASLEVSDYREADAR